MFRGWVGAVAWLMVPLGLLAGGACNNSGSGRPPRVQPPLARGPFLAEATTTSIVVAWSTSTAGIGMVEYGLDPSYGSSVVEASPTRRHAVSITGLTPGTAYLYRVSSAGLVLASGKTFRTARAPSDPRLLFIAMGDTGSGDAHQLAMAERAIAVDPDLWIHTGDVIYPAGEPANFDPLFFEPYAALIDHVPFYTCLGNHDVLTVNGQPYLDAFHLPHNNPQGTERYYSFDAANCHFIALDSNGDASPGMPMGSWLQQDLSSTTAVWKIVFFHHPPFSSALHTSDLDMRHQLEPVFDAAGVDLVLNGHDHDYERTYPLLNAVPVNKSQEPNYTSPGGVIYVVTGGGGKELYDRTQTNAFTAVFESVHHLVQVEISGRSLTLTAIRENGTILDSMTIDK